MLTISATTEATTLKADSHGHATAVLRGLRIAEDDPLLGDATVAGSVDWGDGTVVQYSPVASPRAVSELIHQLSVGAYVIRIEAWNYRRPRPDTAQLLIDLTVSAQAVAARRRILYGPILPRDHGVPNESQWNFSLGDGSVVLESSVKMLLSTAKGERVHFPEYGTNLRRILFEPAGAPSNALVADEVSRALSQWEPRVALAGLSIQQAGKDIRVSISLSSNYTDQLIQLGLTFAQ